MLWEEWWLDSMHYFSTRSLSTSMALHQWGTSVCVPYRYHALSYLHSQALTAWITSSSVSNFVLWTASFRAPNRWKSEGARPGLWGDGGNTVKPNFVTASRVFIFVCRLALSSWGQISVGLSWYQLINIIPEFFQHPDVCIGDESSLLALHPY